ncbi:MAG: type II toxin-antitoxin system RelE/ParE family toxin [candidate division WOR-3 bacterium]
MDSYEIQWKGSAERELRRLDPQQIPQIIQAVDALANAPFPRGCRKLHGAERAYRIRVGEYRVVYQVDVKAKVVTIYHVRPRGKAYRR